jgi:hypothetical protein
MKKKVRKLVLTRETLRPLESSGALGGGSYICTQTYNYTNCGECCSTTTHTDYCNPSVDCTWAC